MSYKKGKDIEVKFMAKIVTVMNVASFFNSVGMVCGDLL